MPLRRLTALETTKLRDERAELQRTIDYLNGLLADPGSRRSLIATELIEIKEKFSNPRRSRIIPDEGEMSLEDLIADDKLVVTVTANGYIKSVSANVYRHQGRGGRGVRAENMREDDVIDQVLHTTAHAYLLFFTNRGKVYRIRAHELPRKDRTAKGVVAHSVLPLQPDERIEAVVDTRDYETARFLVIVTRNGQVKKSRFSDYASRQSQLIAIKLQEGDEVVAVRTTGGNDDLLAFTRAGQGIRFAETDIRPMGRDTMGVRGIKLRAGDAVVSAAGSGDGDEVLLLTTGGYGKRVRVSEFPAQRRGGFGVKAIKLTRVRGQLVAARAIQPGTEVFVISTDGVVIRTGVDAISRQRRDSSGVKVMNTSTDAEVSAFTLVPQDEDDPG